MNRHRKVLATLLLLCLSGCVEDERYLEVSQARPARSTYNSIHSVAILPVEGPGGEAFTDAMAFALVSRSYLRVADQRSVRDALGMRNAAYLSSYELSVLADRLRVDALLVTEMPMVDVQEEHHWKQQVSNFGEIQTAYERHVDVLLQARIRTFDRSGNVVDEADLDASRFDIPTGSVVLRGPPRTDPGFLAALFPSLDAMAYLRRGCAEMAGSFVGDLQPVVTRNLVVLLTNDSVSDSLDAYHAARRGEWAHASTMYRAMVDHANWYAPNDVRAAAYYNWGVALTYNRDYDMAAYALNEVSRLAQRPRLHELAAQAQRDLSRERLAYAQGERMGWFEVKR